LQGPCPCGDASVSWQLAGGWTRCSVLFVITTNYDYDEGRQKKNGKTTNICASSPKQLRTFFFLLFLKGHFCAFLDKGSSKTRGEKLSAFPKKRHQGNIFSGGICFPGGFL
jgi:hypothetical protein